MPFFGVEGVPGPLALAMRVVENEIVEAVWGVSVPQKGVDGRPDYRLHPEGWFLLNALTCETRFTHWNQVYSPVDGKPIRRD